MKRLYTRADRRPGYRKLINTHQLHSLSIEEIHQDSLPPYVRVSVRVVRGLHASFGSAMVERPPLARVLARELDGVHRRQDGEVQAARVVLGQIGVHLLRVCDRSDHPDPTTDVGLVSVTKP